ncbi:hypothetical protein, conserved [Eimeria maxima]|uniref:Uncharacterized protein n=1 Tax=Eimeria maxima TaxID=5804 RepID=U6LZ04_EIMMA|nr:hypothetical protein, conserved [Eimeria maxima]CDJ56068.1 hypothetical protein, conserved [Eimeria maxima]
MRQKGAEEDKKETGDKGTPPVDTERLLRVALYLAFLSIDESPILCVYKKMDEIVEQDDHQNDKEKFMDTLLSSLGAAFSDLNSVVSEQLNEDFALRNHLPLYA